MSHLSEARRVFDAELAGLRAVRSQLGPEFERAVDHITRTIRARGKVVVAGIGKSGNIAHKIAATFTSTGTPSVVLNAVDALHGDLGIVSDGDVLLLLSYSGETEELLNLLPALKRFSVGTLAFTGSPRSTLAGQSDLVLSVKVPREACPFNLAPTASTTAMLALGDALAMAVLKARGFRREDFARHHPSGAIGRALLLRVHEIMRGGDKNAVAGQDTTVREALLVMTRARTGSVSVVNRNGRLAGVFTDGDFRRCMAEDEGVLEKPLKTVMTRRPVRIKENALAVQALKIFHEKRIDDLIVVNARNEPVGLIDSQDLPKLKLT